MRPARRIIAIAGAGIAGLTAALCLSQAGFRILLFEKASKPATTGTGIQVSPNAFRVLEGLGLSRSLKTAGFAPESINIGSGLDGSSLTEFKLGHTAHNRHGAPYLVLHRIDLVQILETACADREDIEFLRGHTVCDIAEHQNGVTVLSETPGAVREDVVMAVIGADGTWSKLRSFVPHSALPQFTGKIAWRALADIESVPNSISRHATGLWLGHHTHLVHYPIRQSQLLNIIAITPWRDKAPPKPGWLHSADPRERRTAFENWDEDLQALLSLDLDWGGWPIFSVDRIGPCVHGPLCLIGDAHHAMVPFGAQGGAAGIEDAQLLARECEKLPDNIPAALESYQKLRYGRLRRVLTLSRNNGRIYHLPPPLDRVRNFVMAKASQEQLQNRMDWLYGWQGAPRVKRQYEV